MVRNAMMMAALGVMLGVTAVYAQEAPEPKPVRFDAMVKIMDLEHGTLTATRPGQAPEKVVSYKAYPYGTVFEADAAARFRVMFSGLTYAVVRGPAKFVPRASDEWRKVAVEVQKGDMNLSVDQRALAGQFSLVTPLGTFSSLQGMSKLHVGDVNKGAVSEDDFSFRTLSGSAVFNGLHYTMGGMTQANAFATTDATGMGTSAVTGKLGEVKMDLPAGGGKIQPFSLTPGAVVKITRAKARGSDNWVVSVLTLYANGEAKNYFCYVENRGEGFYTGELIAEMLPEDDAEEPSEGAQGDVAEGQPSAAGDAAAPIPDELGDFDEDLL